MKDSSNSNQDSTSAPLTDIEELSRVFSQVVELSAERQNARLVELCPDEIVQSQVRAMLDADADSDPLLDHSLVPKSIEESVGERIDGYELLEELARGGMGVVFMAEQLQPVRRKVALKVIKPGVDTREVIARFDAERQALSLMDHPNIAKVFDAGTTAAGRPYFVMELVQGQPITAYCHQKRLPVKERLILFLSVCRAIQHAHQKGVIHRDIKPSNVLVAEYDSRPVAKVIDFGVAKAINQALTDMTMQTGLGQIIGTFEYMSPEQSRVNQLDVDTRSDIYSLGVLLYELLTGCPPFDKEHLRSVAWDEMLRIIREDDPPKPSVRLSELNKQHDLTETREEPAREKRDQGRHSVNRDVGVTPKLGSLVRNELDWIVMKAMEKDRTRRYETPNALANDIGRFLRGDAVTACPPSPFYLFRKFARRNKVALATSTVVAASLVFGIIGTTWQAVRAGRAEKIAAASRDSATSSRDEAETIIAFLKEHLLSLAGTESHSSAGMQPNPSARSLTLDRVRTQVDLRFANQPEIQAKLKNTLASSFNSIGRYDVAASLYKDVLEYLESKDSETLEESIRVMRQLGKAHINQSQFIEAEHWCRKAFDYSQHQFDSEHELTLLLRNDIAFLLHKQGRYQEAETEYQKCLLLSNHVLGENHPDALEIKSNLAESYESRGQLDEAEKLHKLVLEARRSVFSPDDPRIAASLCHLGRCYLRRAQRDSSRVQFKKSASHLEQGLEKYKATRSLDHPETLQAQWTLAQVYCELRRQTDATPLLEGLVQRFRRLRGDDHATTLDAMNTLGWAHMHQGNLVNAENILSQAVTTRRRLRLRDASTLRAMENLAIVYHQMGKLQKSIDQNIEILDLAPQSLPPEHPVILSCQVRLGLNYVNAGRTNDGINQLELAFNADNHSSYAFEIAKALAVTYQDTGDNHNAIRWINRQIQIGRDTLTKDSSQLASVLANGGSRLLRMKAFHRAESLLRECLGIWNSNGADSWTMFDAHSMLGEALSAQKKHKDAEPHLLKSFDGLVRRKDLAGENATRELKHACVKSTDRLITFYDLAENSQEADRWRTEMGVQLLAAGVPTMKASQ